MEPARGVGPPGIAPNRGPITSANDSCHNVTRVVLAVESLLSRGGGVRPWRKHGPCEGPPQIVTVRLPSATRRLSTPQAGRIRNPGRCRRSPHVRPPPSSAPRSRLTQEPARAGRGPRCAGCEGTARREAGCESDGWAGAGGWHRWGARGTEDEAGPAPPVAAGRRHWCRRELRANRGAASLGP